MKKVLIKEIAYINYLLYIQKNEYNVNDIIIR